MRINKIRQFIIKHLRKRNNRKSKYQLSSINRIRQARIIDFINEFCIRYYIAEHKTKPTFNALEDAVYMEFKLHSIATELLINTMLKYKYISEIKYEDESLNEFTCNTEGFELYLSGGLTSKIKRETRKARLVQFAGIASIIVGLYYLLMLTKEIHSLINCLVCH